MTLYLHIGHTKTGTSAIQSFLAQNQKKLYDLGITYPTASNFDRAIKNYITSGNGHILLKEEKRIKQEVKSLYSSEKMFDKFVNSPSLFKRILQSNDDVNIIIYTRDVLPYLVSSWNQAVKRGGYQKQVEEYLVEEVQMTYSHLLDYIQQSIRGDFKLIIRNYSRIDNLVEDFLGILLPSDLVSNLNLSFEHRVNRSLTIFESNIVRLINRFDASIGRVISDELCNLHPNISDDNLRITEETYNQVVRMYQPIIDTCNMLLQDSEQILIGEQSVWCKD